jgi:hypothetical protein
MRCEARTRCAKGSESDSQNTREPAFSAPAQVRDEPKAPLAECNGLVTRIDQDGAGCRKFDSPLSTVR